MLVAMSALASNTLQYKVCELRQWLLRTRCPHYMPLGSALLSTSSRPDLQTETPITDGVLEYIIRLHRNTERLRLEGTSGGHIVQPALLKQGHLELVAQDHVQTAFEYLQ